MLWALIKNEIPWWLYLLVISIGVGALWYFFSPILLVVWGRLPNWAKYAIGGLLAIGLSAVYGRNKGFGDARAVQQKIEEKAVQKREEIHEDVQKTNTVDLDKRLSKWLRD